MNVSLIVFVYQKQLILFHVYICLVSHKYNYKLHFFQVNNYDILCTFHIFHLISIINLHSLLSFHIVSEMLVSFEVTTLLYKYIHLKLPINISKLQICIY